MTARHLDGTRPVRDREVLPRLIHHLQAIGLVDDRHMVCVVIGTRTARAVFIRTGKIDSVVNEGIADPHDIRQGNSL